MSDQNNLTTFYQILADALADATCLRLVLSRPAGGHDIRKVTVRPVEIRGTLQYQFALQRTGAAEAHENLPPETALSRVREFFPSRFGNAHLFTTEEDYAARSKGGTIKLRRSAPTVSETETAHNRTKQYLIPEGTPCPFLIEIGVMQPNGQVRKSKYQKFRQINRFCELVEDIVPALSSTGRLRIVDFGCGKSYLTFALHHLLTVIHGRDVEITGLDRKQEVIEDCTRIARKLNCQGLTFRAGDIADDDSAGDLDLAVSLHACDTATDHALAHAIRRDARVILAVPCCQHEFARQLVSDDLSAITRHGILHERLAALATDALRAEALELCGYTTQVLEFIDMEHTAKNVLIRAVRRGDGEVKPSNARYRRLKQSFGLGALTLEDLLGDRLPGEDSCE